MNVKLRWATTNIDAELAYMARVSNPDATPEDPYEKLIGYLIEHLHWSPLEMVNICLDIETTRDIGRQMLRHGIRFQEFSQRYAKVQQEKAIIVETARLQDPKNRQNSIPCDDPFVNDSWRYWQDFVWNACWIGYQACLKMGIAKELARKLLPEGLTQTHMFANGSVRDWFHYLTVRTGPETQLEHRELAKKILVICLDLAPATFGHVK